MQQPIRGGYQAPALRQQAVRQVTPKAPAVVATPVRQQRPRPSGPPPNPFGNSRPPIGAPGTNLVKDETSVDIGFGGNFKNNGSWSPPTEFSHMQKMGSRPAMP